MSAYDNCKTEDEIKALYAKRMHDIDVEQAKQKEQYDKDITPLLFLLAVVGVIFVGLVVHMMAK